MQRMLLGAAALFCLCASGLAAEFSGALEDAGCYDTQQRNLSPFAAESPATHDWQNDIRICRPKPHTNRFVIVRLDDGQGYYLDAKGNEEAARWVQQNGTKRLPAVVVTGELRNGSIEVDSLLPAKSH